MIVLDLKMRRNSYEILYTFRTWGLRYPVHYTRILIKALSAVVLHVPIIETLRSDFEYWRTS